MELEDNRIGDVIEGEVHVEMKSVLSYVIILIFNNIKNQILLKIENY